MHVVCIATRVFFSLILFPSLSQVAHMSSPGGSGTASSVMAMKYSYHTIITIVI